MNTEVFIGKASIYEDNPTAGIYVYLCNLCGQPMAPDRECNSGIHVGPNGGPKGKPVKSVDLVWNLRNANHSRQ